MVAEADLGRKYKSVFSSYSASVCHLWEYVEYYYCIKNSNILFFTY
ncbi:hypothetical protein HMPREF0556_11542 [Listeria grayi DSM 20601]|uniref:Uncharacterized protein n=1 Tax=Listeria grayi DSM 20601 TaxID=525367 RepID=D7UZL2_LISGR|nr:hypothetical protein HMPREF0556_11542 [Listeria grayi DSM 20601]